ncbi:Uncharacterised protein [Staphylococcus xylosus]|nr:Uncharacterised protein [Staphylococcus xylosus]
MHTVNMILNSFNKSKEFNLILYFAIVKYSIKLN